MAFRNLLRGLGRVILSSIVLVVLGLVFFVVTAWIVTSGVEFVRGQPPSADFVALSAALLSLGSLAGSSYSMGGIGGNPGQEDPYGTSEVA